MCGIGSLVVLWRLESESPSLSHCESPSLGPGVALAHLVVGVEPLVHLHADDVCKMQNERYSVENVKHFTLN